MQDLRRLGSEDRLRTGPGSYQARHARAARRCRPVRRNVAAVPHRAGVVRAVVDRPHRGCRRHGGAGDRHLAARALLWEQGLALCREAGDMGEYTRLLANLSEADYQRGYLDAAEAHLDQALTLARAERRTVVEACALVNMAKVARRKGDPARAMRLQLQALRMQVALGDRRQIAACLEHLAQLHAVLGHGQAAARLIGAATSIRTLIGTAQPLPEHADVEDTVAPVRVGLGRGEVGGSPRGWPRPVARAGRRRSIGRERLRPPVSRRLPRRFSALSQAAPARMRCVR